MLAGERMKRKDDPITKAEDIEREDENKMIKHSCLMQQQYSLLLWQEEAEEV